MKYSAPMLKLLVAIGLALAGTHALAASTWSLATGTDAETDATLTSMTAYSGDLSPLSNFRTSGVTWTNYTGSGVGVNGDGATNPNHAMDNVGELEALFLNFNKSVVLSTVTIGWHNTNSSYGTDSDLSVLRYIGDGSATLAEAQASLLASNKTNLTSNGWELVGSYADLVDGQGKATGATDTQGSSWWLISAYNSGYAATANTHSSTSGLSDGNDYMKVLSVAGNVTKTVTPPPLGKAPEPGSLALVGLAMAGMLAVRRRKQQQQAGE